MTGPLLIGIEGLDLTQASRQALLHRAVGGVILFSRNYHDQDQLRALTDGIQALDRERLLILVDQEGGRVQRFKDDFTALPPLAALGRWYSSHPHRALDMAYRHARVMAAEVLASGVDMSLAPVLDLQGVSDVIGDRSFNAQPDAVIDLASHYLAGMRDAGMATCGKHFPGHGSVQADSHHQIVIDQRDAEALTADLKPFNTLHAQLDSIMPAHVQYPALDPLPAGFSPYWLQQRLRSDLAFQGVIISDDLDMAAAHVAGSLLQRLQTCLQAGCNIALVCQPDSAVAILDAIDHAGLTFESAQRWIDRLYGRPSFSLADQLRVPEFRSWRESLNALVEQQHV
ncbi:MAG: beta-N-acetylhexosaminidase [Pseudomonadota bacterium]